MKRKLKCILLVDDDPATNYLHKKIINSVGCAENIAVADTGQEALDYLHKLKLEKQSPPDLILLDINMPVLNAWEFLELYEKLPGDEKSKIIIIMLTTSLNPDDEIRAKAVHEVKGFYLKPLDKEMMQKLLAEHFPDCL